MTSEQITPVTQLLTREWQPAKPPLHTKACLATPGQSRAAARRVGGIGPMSCRRTCRACSASRVLDLPQLLLLRSRHTSLLPRGAWTSLSGRLCTGCRRQCPGLSFSVVLLFNILCEKLCSVGTVYIVNKIDQDERWIGVLALHFGKEGEWKWRGHSQVRMILVSPVVCPERHP